MLGLFLELAPIASASSAPYIVEGFTLGDRIQSDLPKYRSYTCNPSHDFEHFTLCELSSSRRTSLGNGLFSSSILHADDGTAVYLMANIRPIPINKTVALAEIDSLSKEVNEKPTKIEWLPQRTGIVGAVIAVWGKIELQRLDQYDIDAVAAGEHARRASLLVDFLGDPTRSAMARLPVYRLAGGAGYLYAASFDSNDRGHRHYVASDVSVPAITQFEPALEQVLRDDQARGGNDYGLWPKVAELTRNLSLDTSPAIANATLDKVFDRFTSKKLRSHVWSLLPLSSVGLGGLASYVYENRIPVYGPNTAYPEIRHNIQNFLAKNPAEPFAEFLYYTIGEFDKALQANPNSIIRSVINYAAGYKALESLLQDIKRTRMTKPIPDWSLETNNETLIALNEKAEFYKKQLLADVVPAFARKAAIAKPYFEAVLRDQTSPLGDDAAYMLGWLAFHQGNFKDALNYTSQALTLGNGDYVPSATRQLARILRRLPPRERIAFLETNPAAAEGLANPILVADPFSPVAATCVPNRTAFEEFNYRQAIDLGREFIGTKVPIDRMPVTTDVSLIKDAIDKMGSLSWEDAECFREVYLLIQESEEHLDYEKYLKTVAADRPENVLKHIRELIQRYNPKSKDGNLGQAAHLIDMTLANLPRTDEYVKLREWLYYRKVRIFVQFNPAAVRPAVAAMEKEFPTSQLLQNALAEQIYAQGARLEDIDAAEETFKKLVSNFPNSNAVDNAYTWMAISYHCIGRLGDAQRIDQEIIRLFPLTRHATYARERLSKPDSLNCQLSILSVADYDGIINQQPN